MSSLGGVREPWGESWVTLLCSQEKEDFLEEATIVVSPEEFEGEGLVNEQAGEWGGEEEKMF